jgi:hypothetical protein
MGGRISTGDRNAGGPPPRGLYDLAALNAEFDREHPYAPASTRPDFLNHPDDSGGLYPAGTQAPPAAPQPRMANLQPGARNAGGFDLMGPLQTPGAQTARDASGRQATNDALGATFGGLYPPGSFGPGGGPYDQATAAPAVAPGSAGPAGLYPAGVNAAGIQDTARSLAAQRAWQKQIAPNLPQDGEAPEIQANKLAYLLKLAQDQAAPAQDDYPAAHMNADGTMTAANAWDAARARTSAPRVSAEQLAAFGHQLMAQGQQPRYVEDPVTGERKLVYGRNVMPSGTNPAKSTKPEFPREITAGGRKLIQVSGDKFTDEKGTPVEWRGDQDRALSVNEFLMSPALATRFDNDYGKYREAFTAAAAKVPATPGAAPAAQAKAGPKVAAYYNHQDVQAEMKRRGLTK